jgi:hypothetical protein
MAKMHAEELASSQYSLDCPKSELAMKEDNLQDGSSYSSSCADYQVAMATPEQIAWTQTTDPILPGNCF